MSLTSMRPALSPVLRHLDATWLRRLAALGLAVLAFGIGRGLLGVQASFAALSQERTELEANLTNIPLLTSDEVRLLRRSLNPRHVALAEQLGIAPVARRSALDSVATAHEFSHVETSWRYVTLNTTHSIPRLTADATASLDSIATRFAARLADHDVPPFKFAISSLLRSSEDQARLRRTNSNAADGNSSHEFGTTYDVAYRRYEPAMGVLPAPRVDERVPTALRPLLSMVLAERQRDNLERLSGSYQQHLDATLGRSLIELENEGVVVVIRERSQPVYHITVARQLVSGPFAEK
jgi:hypothetical protein